MRAVDALMECLKAEGVDVVFGLPGGANLPTYDAFYDAVCVTCGAELEFPDVAIAPESVPRGQVARPSA